MAGKKPGKDGEGSAADGGSPSQPTPSNSENAAEQPDTGAASSGAEGDGAAAGDAVPPEAGSGDAGGDAAVGDAPGAEPASESSSQALSGDSEGLDASAITDSFDKARGTGVATGSIEADDDKVTVRLESHASELKRAFSAIAICVGLAYPDGSAPTLDKLPDWLVELCADVLDTVMRWDPDEREAKDVAGLYKLYYARISRRDHGDNSPFKK